MKKIFCLVVFWVTIIVMTGETAFASSNENNKAVAEDNITIDVAPADKAEKGIYRDIIFDIDELITHSINISRNGSSYSGSYTSAKYETGLSGYQYQISFDWVASINSSGEYIFQNNAIQNAVITTYTNHVLLALSWGSYSYTIEKNTYSVAEDGLSVTFETNYKFVVHEKETAVSHTLEENNTKTIYVNNLL